MVGGVCKHVLCCAVLRWLINRQLFMDCWGYADLPMIAAEQLSCADPVLLSGAMACPFPIIRTSANLLQDMCLGTFVSQ